ncbi:MAG: BrnT family toxin, partial [Microcystis aeruginosa]
MEFEWDDQKNNINIEKHGIDFDFAKEIFSGVWISKPDNRRDYGEERLIALGLLGEFVLVAVYTLREQKIRLISTRRANAEERRIYYEYVERGTIR